MPSTKLTKSVVDTARPAARDYEIRDTIVPGFMCKITPAGRKTFMLSYRTPKGERRKPALGTYGQITVDQARKLAQDFLASVRGGADPSQERQVARTAPTVKDLADRFMVEHSEARNKPSTVAGNRSQLKLHILPALGKLKVADVKRSDVADLIGRLRDRPTSANHSLSLLRKMFNLAELWGLRPDGTNPCRHVQKYTGSKRTRLITDDELARLYVYLDQADAEGLEHPLLTLAIRLQFDLAARMSEVLQLQWQWIDFAQRRVVWPDSKTGGMSKPLSAEAALLLRAAPRYSGSKFVIPALFDGSRPMSKHTYWQAWRRILERAGLPHCGTHAVRHRAATDIANSGVPVKVGMALTAHKTVTMFMRYRIDGGMGAGQHQPQPRVGEGLLLVHRRLCLLLHPDKFGLGGVGAHSAPGVIDAATARHGQQPSLRVGRRAVLRPAFQRGEQRLAQRILRSHEVARARGQQGHEPAVGVPRRPLDRRSCVVRSQRALQSDRIGRTSTAP